jgi:hypothetical protein
MATRTQFPPLAEVTKDYLDTNETAFYLGLKPKSVRAWKYTGKAPIKPQKKINGRDRYSIADVRTLAQAGECA